MIRFLHDLWRDAVQTVFLFAAYAGVVAALAFLVHGMLPHAGLVGGISLVVVWYASVTERT